MRPALQRLLARPSSLEFLRRLVGTSTTTARRRPKTGRKVGRKYGTSAAAVKERDDVESSARHERTNTNNSEFNQHATLHRLRSREGQNFDPNQLLQAGDNFISIEDEIVDQEILSRRKMRKEQQAMLDRGLWTGEFLTSEEGVQNAISNNITSSKVIPALQGPKNPKDSVEPTSVDSIHSSVRYPVTSQPGMGGGRHDLQISLPCIDQMEIESKNETYLSTSNSRLLGHWERQLSSHKRLEFESALDSPINISRRRLVDTDVHRGDLRLWACLLIYRKRVHGRDGALMFWKAVRTRGLHLPCTTNLGDIFWPSFLDLGLEDASILEQVCEHADRILEQSSQRWNGLYVHVVRHFLLQRDGASAIMWHNRLFARHPPGANRFARLCRQVAHQAGDLEALKVIYKQTGYRNAYSKIIPVLCAREEFQAALDWHYTFLQHGDLPSVARMVEPLVQFLAVYYPPQATKLTKSLVDVGASFAPTLPTQREINTKISREMMNLIHGKEMNVVPKKYNDNLGARWFATTWVSLDTAINAVHALGVREIGPLSLQAIALRDPEAKNITARIAQLRHLGISIGKSLFSRAVEQFANPRSRQEESLRGLLKSDQHPDELENAELQEALLATYAQSKDWAQYRRTIEIRSLASRVPRIEAANIILRGLILRRNKSAIFHQLEDMQLQNVLVTTASTKALLQHLLHDRRSGNRPHVPRGVTNHGLSNDLNIAIAVLKKIMLTGSYVPVTQWREIVRRLGMLGKFHDLRALCLYLAEWYGPKQIQRGWYRVPVEVPTKHPLHPLSVLFSPSLQKALVEWGFIAALKRNPHAQQHANYKRLPLMVGDTSALPDIAAGIRLLKELSMLGVHVRGPDVKKAIFNRLVTYLGPGRSSRRHNRWGQERLAGRMSEVAEKIDVALGGEYFTSSAINLDAKIKRIALTRMAKTRTRRFRLRYSRERRTVDSRLLSSPRPRHRK